MLTLQELQREASATGFRAEIIEKVLHLVGLLKALGAHPALRDSHALKGGTALNLFTLRTPRLSVDVDINYIGAADRETMLAQRPVIDQAIGQVCQREGLQVRRIPSEHAGGKWRLSYLSAAGQPGKLELDLNYMHRVPLWPVNPGDSHPLAGTRARAVPILDIHELAAGKLTALFSREASRDLFDTRELLKLEAIDTAKLRLAFVVYGGMSRRDWRDIAVSDVDTTPTDVDRMLVPVLRRDLAPDRRTLDEWTHRLVADCRSLLSKLLPLNPDERTFVEELNESGAIRPELLTSDPEMQETIRNLPGLKWKAVNVRKHRGLSEPHPDER